MAILATVSMHVEHDPKRNFAEYERYIAEAIKINAKLVAFPECSLQGFLWTHSDEKKAYLDHPELQEYYQRTAEAIPGPTTLKLANLAKQHNMYIQIGLVEKALKNGAPVFYNAAAMVGPEGIINVHRKAHGSPNPLYQYGTEYNAYPTSLGKMGSVICADLTFVGPVSTLALKGAEIAVNSSATHLKSELEKDSHDSRYELLCRANAAFHHIWFVSSNEVGRGGRSTGLSRGHSLIVDPNGKVLADGGYQEGLVYADVDLKRGAVESIQRAGKATRLTYDKVPGLYIGDGPRWESE